MMKNILKRIAVVYLFVFCVVIFYRALHPSVCVCFCLWALVVSFIFGFCAALHRGNLAVDRMGIFGR